MTQLITHDEGTKGDTKVHGFVTFIWHTDPQHAAGDTHTTHPVHALERIAIQSPHGHAKTNTTVMRSLKNCATGSQACTGPMRTHCVTAFST
jgi:hypothetical protein